MLSTKSDLYTKVVLTVIAFMLVMIGCHQYVSPATIVKAEGPFAGVLYSGPNKYSFFDTKSGDLWLYYPACVDAHGESHSAKWTNLGKVTQLGQPLANAETLGWRDLN
jgi:hypothetical protein